MAQRMSLMSHPQTGHWSCPALRPIKKRLDWYRCAFGLAVTASEMGTTTSDRAGMAVQNVAKGQERKSSARRGSPAATGLERFDQASPVGTMAAVSTIKITLLSGARVQCNTPFGTVKP